MNTARTGRMLLRTHLCDQGEQGVVLCTGVVRLVGMVYREIGEREQSVCRALPSTPPRCSNHLIAEVRGQLARPRPTFLRPSSRSGILRHRADQFVAASHEQSARLWNLGSANRRAMNNERLVRRSNIDGGIIQASLPSL